MLLSKSPTCDNYRGINPDCRKGVPMLFNAFPPSFHMSGWLYGGGHCHEGESLL